MPRITINIVTHNSADTIDACLQGVTRQHYRDYQVTVFDNASTDDSLARVRAWESPTVRVVANEQNTYFARAHNWAIDHSDSEFVLTLNPDVMMYPDYFTQVIAAFDRSSQIGSVNGKLLLVDQEELSPELLRSPPNPLALIDGAGLTMRRSRRPYLRGNRQLTRTHCLQPHYIFGVDAACGAYRRSMLEDIAIDGEYFDNDFVIYREDVDLAWRAQLSGWDSYYTPDAVAYHVRGFQLGRGRGRMAPALKRHSVKNGWLLSIKNDSVWSMLRCVPWILPYQLKILAGILTVEHGSLGAVGDVIKLLPTMRRKRRIIHARRRRTEREMREWFV